jgi:NADPH:quinone reductase-like Zn-dependent oxidoreductase
MSRRKDATPCRMNRRHDQAFWVGMGVVSFKRWVRKRHSLKWVMRFTDAGEITRQGSYAQYQVVDERIAGSQAPKFDV